MTARTLLLTLSIDDPPRGGVALRSSQIAATLAAHGPLGIATLQVCRARPAIAESAWFEPAAAAELTTLPDPARDLSWLRDEDWDPSLTYLTDELREHVTAAVDAFGPAVVVVDQLYLCGYVDVATAGGARWILNEHNVEADLQDQLAKQATLPPERVLRSHFTRRTTRLEQAMVAAADQVWVCSDNDRDSIAGRYGRRDGVSVIPNALSLPERPPQRRERDPGEARLVFPGDFSYPPNRQAATLIIERLVPALRDRLERFEVWLAGRYPTAEMMEAHRAVPELRVTGPVEDMVPVLVEADLMLAPLQSGSGSRFKLLEAFAARLPVVATPKAAEGLDVVNGTHLLLADDPETLVNAVVALVADPARGRALADAGWELVRSRYSWEAASALVGAALASL